VRNNISNHGIDFGSVRVINSLNSSVIALKLYAGEYLHTQLEQDASTSHIPKRELPTADQSINHAEMHIAWM